MVRIRTQYTRVTPEGILPIDTRVNAGDYIFRQRGDDKWDVLLIWIRSPFVSMPPEDLIMIAGLMPGTKIFGHDFGGSKNTTVWWDKPERALKAVYTGLSQASFEEAQIKEIFQRAYNGCFTEFAENPEQIPYLSDLSSGDSEELRRVFRRAKGVLAEYLQN
jgi:hypothetical protein